MSKRQYFVAVPSHRALEREGRDSFVLTLVSWDLHYNKRTEGDYFLIECNVRGERKRLRELLEYAYKLPTKVIVR